jgi:hypothetical protein
MYIYRGHESRLKMCTGDIKEMMIISEWKRWKEVDG